MIFSSRLTVRSALRATLFRATQRPSPALSSRMRSAPVSKSTSCHLRAWSSPPSHPGVEGHGDEWPEVRWKVLHQPAFFLGAEAAVAGVVLLVQLDRPHGVVGEPPLSDGTVEGSLVSPADRASHFIKALEESLSGLGYVKGSNVLYEHRFADGRTERLSALAKELIALNVDVIIAGNNASIAAAKQATSMIPIIMTYGIDPIGVGFIAGLARPGGNITGLTADVTADTWGKRLE